MRVLLSLEPLLAAVRQHGKSFAEGKIEGLPKHASGDVLFTGPGSEGQFDMYNRMKVVTPGEPLNGNFTCDGYCVGHRQAICVAQI